MAQDAGAAAATVDVLPLWEMIVFCVVVVGVIGLGIWKSSDSGESTENKEEKGAADYFLAGRGLSWWLVGFSLLAANISTEQFVGMSGQSADWLGLAIAGYEWLAAIVLVIVAFTFLPMLLKRGVFTIPQFLEERYNGVARVAMAFVNLLILVGVPTAAVIYAGASVVSIYFDLSVTTGCLIIAGAATVYVYVGGLKACAWTDLIWGAALIVGGGVVAYFAIMALGAFNTVPQEVLSTASTTANTTAEAMASTGSQFCDGLNRLVNLNAGEVSGATNGIGGKLHMMREASDPVMPWTVYLLGLWIPNFFYWGLNQYIMQRTLASKSLEEGQLGIVFAAFLKLLIPFVVIIPGILAYNLYRGDLAAKADSNATAIIQKAEQDAATSGKKVIFDIAASRLVREDSAAASVELIRKNLQTVGAADSIPAVDALAAQLSAIPAAQIAERSAKADEILKAEKAATAAARADITGYTVSTTLAAYQYDYAFATLLRKLLPGTGWAWFVLAALFGAVVSSLASMLNSASTLFTMDLYNKAKEVATGKGASDKQLVAVGKVAVLVCAVIATVVAPFLDNPAFGGIFTFIQEFQGFLSPGVLAVFLFGFFVPKCPRVFGWLGIVVGIVAFAAFKWVEILGCTGDSFLNRMGYSLIVVCLVGLILTIRNHIIGGESVVLQDKGIIEMKTSGRAKAFGLAVIVATVALYIIFW
ncbi:MAG: sodium/solute symporter [Akkermansiaceae bacterium]|nr:sodium/solute symporter [Akkermansiaceae bacterium]